MCCLLLQQMELRFNRITLVCTLQGPLWTFLLAGIIGPKDVLLVKDLVKGQAQAEHQRYFDAKGP
jgi:hypothetical protein